MSEVEFGPYRLIALLGRGGMGEVWRARDTERGREVAIKVLGPWLSSDPQYATRFRREAALAAKLTDPHIIPIHDFGRIGGQLFMTMPLIDGRDLGETLADGPLPPDRAAVVIEQVADALDAAHAAGLVHRDVKPSNVLVTSRRGRDFAYLIDFGIARPTVGTSLTPTGSAIGTPAYMAPERFAGDGDLRGDVYALGCVLHQLLTGQPPFPETNPLALLRHHADTPPPRPTVLRPDLPAAIDAVVARAMAKDPEHRWPTAGELADATRRALLPTQAPMLQPTLKPVREPEPLPAGPPALPPWPTTPPTQEPPPSPRRRPEMMQHPSLPLATEKLRPAEIAARRVWTRRSVLLAGAAGAALAIGLPAAIIAGPGERASDDAAESTTVADPAATPVPTTERELVGHVGGVFAVAVTELDGRPVAVTGGSDQTVRVWDIATGSQIGTPFTGHTTSVRAVAVAELNGRPVAVTGSTDRTVRVWDLATGTQIGTPFSSDFGGVLAVVVTELNGRPVAVAGGADHAVRVLDLATGAQIGTPFTGHTKSVQAVAVTELNGRPVAVSGSGVDSGSTDDTVRVWDLATGTQIGTPFTGHTSSVLAVAVTELYGLPVAVTGSTDGTVRVWDLATGTQIGTPLTGDTGSVFTVVVTELNGRPVVVTGGADHTVQVRDLATGTQIGPPFTGHTSSVLAVAVTELNGHLVAVSGSTDKTVRVWDLTNRTT